MKDIFEGPENLKLANGYKTLTNQEAEASAFLDVEKHKQKYTPQALKVNFTTINSLDKLEQSLDATLSAGVTAGPIPASVKASINTYFSTSDTQSHCYTIITGRKISRIELINGVELSKEATELLQNGNLSEFYNKYGDTYVKKVIYGIQFLAILQLDKNEYEKQRKIAGELAGQAQGAQGELKLTSINNMINSSAVKNKIVRTFGVNTSWDFETPEELEKNANKHIDVTSDTILETEKKSYMSCTNDEKCFATLRKLQEQNNEAAKIFDEIKDKIKFIQNTELLDPNNLITTCQNNKINSLQKHRYEKLQTEAKTHLQTLQDLRQLIDNGTWVYNQLSYIKDKLAEIETWKHNNSDINKVAKRITVAKLTLRKHEKKSPKFDLQELQNIEDQNLCLLIKFPKADKKNGANKGEYDDAKFEITLTRYDSDFMFFKKVRATAQPTISGSRCYLPFSVKNQKYHYLSVTLKSAAFDHDVPIQIEIVKNPNPGKVAKLVETTEATQPAPRSAPTQHKDMVSKNASRDMMRQSR